jgi:hypothetical protein
VVSTKAENTYDRQEVRGKSGGGTSDSAQTIKYRGQNTLVGPDLGLKRKERSGCNGTACSTYADTGQVS